MGKIVMFLLIAAVLSVAHPEVRERMKPHVEPALNPIYSWQVNSRLAEIVRYMEAQQARGNMLPNADGFAKYLERAFPGQPSVDPWGTAYYLKGGKMISGIASAGPDGVIGTDDDIVKSFAKPLPASPR